ncbi:hypothetical protein HDU97_006810 [Phlyctochytrium planicorne]|nr:hypothetical protein HDU97_006810 [Phlyctochytrium planicorne]
MLVQLFKSLPRAHQFAVTAITLPGFALGWYMTEAAVDHNDNLFTRFNTRHVVTASAQQQQQHNDLLRLYSVSSRAPASSSSGLESTEGVRRVLTIRRG